MKKWMSVLLVVLVCAATSFARADDPGAPIPSGQSVLIYFKYQCRLGDPAWPAFRDGVLVSRIRGWKSAEFSSSQIRFLSEDSDNGLLTIVGNTSRTWPAESAVLAASGLPVPPPYAHSLTPVIDALIKIDLPPGPLSQAQLDALRSLRVALESRGIVNISKTNNYLCYEQREARPTDVFMAFTIRYLPETVKSRVDQDTYWREHHGRFAVSLGLPPQVVTYSQLHADLQQPDDDIFDTDYEGLSFETIESRNSVVEMSLDPSALAVNTELIKDEQNFTRAPNMLVFKEIRLDP